MTDDYEDEIGKVSLLHKIGGIFIALICVPIAILITAIMAPFLVGYVIVGELLDIAREKRKKRTCSK